MESPFEYSTHVTDTNFIGRTKEVSTLCRIIKERKNILLYGAPKIGKQSIINNAFLKLQQEQYPHEYIEYNLFNIRCIEAMLLKFTNLFFSKFAKNQLEWYSYQKKFIPSAPYEIEQFKEGKIRFTYKSKDLLNSVQIDELLMLPENFAIETGKHILLYFKNFQDTLLLDDSRHFFKITDNVWSKNKYVNYIITGEHTNAMKYIFSIQKHYYGFAEEININPINEKIFSDFLIKGYLKAGKVIQPEDALYMYKIVGCNPFYAQQLATLCYDITKGYVNKLIIEEGIQRLINIYEYHFHFIISELSKHQIRFLQAIMSGVTRFSSADVLEKYKLNSSANVNRVKEALVKKEIITFVNKKGVFLDPLLELWLKRYFFIKNGFKKTIY